MWTRRAILCLSLATLTCFASGFTSRVVAGDRKTVFVPVPPGSISGAVSFGFHKVANGRSITNAVLNRINLCQVVSLEQIDGTTIRVGFQSPPGSILGPTWGGFPCGAYLDIVEE